ncbi:MAG: hypothetical protein WCO14_01785 [bacterium]
MRQEVKILEEERKWLCTSDAKWLLERKLDSEVRVLDLQLLTNGHARLSELSRYLQQVIILAGEGNEVILTGQAPVWLYLKVAHALHGKARRLVYRSPVCRDLEIFDHSP